MIQTTFEAMGTTIDVVADDMSGVDATRELFASLEQRLSRFRDTSELSEINESRAPVVEVSSVMAGVLAVADELRTRTAGLVDPAVGGAVSSWGYDRTYAEVRDLDHEPDPAPPADWTLEARRLHRRPGTLFDLGGIAKGWAADEAVESGRALMVSAGGDVRSSLATARVAVVDPWGDSVTVHLGAGALATSSVTRRRWRAGGRAAHHLIDPRYGSPAVTPILSATVSCASAAESEAAAKAVLLLGDRGLAWADQQTWVESAMVVWETGSVFATKGWVAA